MQGQDELERLAGLLADKVKGGTRRKLRVAEPLPFTPDEDAIQRDARIRRIKWIAKRPPGLSWLLDQLCFGQRLEWLSKDDLQRVHQEMERALACALDGVPLEDAGFVRAMYQEAV